MFFQINLSGVSLGGGGVYIISEPERMFFHRVSSRTDPKTWHPRAALRNRAAEGGGKRCCWKARSQQGRGRAAANPRALPVPF